MSFVTPTSLSTRPCRYLSLRRPARRFSRVQRIDTSSWVVHSIRGIQNFDGSFSLAEESQESLYEMLKSETFNKLVVKECRLPEGEKWEFAEMLFQPVPWSPNTKKGMPQEFEIYLEDPSYMIINIPPTVMFKAKIFDPSRLCAIFKKALN